MRAIAITEPGGPEVLVVEDRARPEPRAGEILIKVHAAGVNRPDCMQRAGKYPPPPGASDIPGLEIAGEVVAAGDQVTSWQVGDRVCALVPGGGYAEYCVADARNALPVPRGLTMTEAAAIPETFFTVWSNVFDRAALKPGETFLVHGGTSGIGTTAIQLAKAFGATVFATAGSDEKCAVMRDLGADMAINYKDEDFVEVIRRETDKKGVDVILDMVGGDYVNRNLKVAAVEGRIVQIAFLNGNTAEIDLSQIMLKRLVFTGSTLRARDAHFKGEIAQALRRQVWPLLDDRSIAPVMDSLLPLEKAAAAHARMEEGGHIGKIVLEVG
ncbi:NAD(P)H-quinone oxidoreductase [Pseudohoeflea suaedae]|uniref:NAD(P)H-quinone oxidoreductase n=1 Tax=Pseudohoeflea suaedae TaxID=877384 RepID=A0A4R5PIM2_9HYPH|nr:NAD(P)H-quinone oxidoreductase [Pseudohoeflea suaedae]TDH35087.1 NAD(P)H-quinone oxidoreductase [Pseudohoeflea suaedae]